jgi:hypothetical protein
MRGRENTLKPLAIFMLGIVECSGEECLIY